MATAPTKLLQVEVSAEMVDRLEEWSKKTGRSLPDLVAAAFTLLRYAIEEQLVREEPEGKQVKIVV